MGAPVGNQNAAKAKVWTAAINRALERRKPADERLKAIDELADKLLEECAKGDLAALKELGDRLEGKVPQGIIGGGADDPPITVREILIRGIDATRDRSAEEGP
jgi:hypothetical protein